jgi:branched-chain amino acid transport system substrate-binding protein
MRKFKKALLLLLAVMLIGAFALSGCGGSGDDGAVDPGSSGSSAVSSGGGSDGDTIKVGYVAPFTGPLSVFTVATDWANDKCLAVINDENGGIEVDGVKKKIEVIKGDSESDPTKAAEVSQKLVVEDKVDILVGAWTPDTTMAVSGTGERYKIPTYISNSPADSWNEGGPYYWAMGAMFYFDGYLDDYANAWDKLDTNKRVGFIFDSEVDGVTISKLFQEKLEAKGYTVVDPGRFPKGTNDYTSHIKAIQDGDCDIVVANMIGPDFQTLWKQFHSANYIPKAFTIGKAVHFQADADALAEGTGNGLMSEVLWDRTFPFTSSLLGLSCDELAQAWEDENNTQFPATLGYDVALWEILGDSLERAGTTEPEALRQAILDTEYDGIYGHLSFDDKQVAEVPCVTVQWLTGDKWSYEKKIVASESFPIIPSVDPIVIPDTTRK